MAEALGRRDWVHLRVPLHGPDATDAGARVLGEVVGPVIERLAGEVRGLGWFFLRFRDATGMHLRLRAGAAPADLAWVAPQLEDALSAAGLETTPGFYSPETAKFGDGPAMAEAEGLFRAGSEMALELMRAGAPRVPAAAAVMEDLVGGLPQADRAGFLHHYAWYWSGGPLPGRRVPPTALPDRRVPPTALPGRRVPPTALPGRRVPPTAGWRGDPRASDRLDALREQVHAVRAEPRSAQALDRFRRSVDRSVERAVAPASGRRRTAAFLRFQHLHLTDNRLGVFPATEAALARLLWLAVVGTGPDR